jgi:photosynthetic reaction center cytochrome c subunit
MNAKPASALAIVACLAIGGFTMHRAKAQSSAPATTPKKAEEQFKNIQTFKGLPADQVIPAMQFISVSLGVECEFCHVRGAFEKDDKKQKLTARKMIDMMAAINKDNFEGHREVTCYSCHRGSPDPVAIPIISAEEAKAPETKEENKQVSGPTGDQLIDKYIQALGGAAAINKVNSQTEKGTIDIAGKSFPVDLYTKEPGKHASFVHMPEGDNVTAFDGHEGWLGAPGRPPREMHGPDLDAAAMDADLHFATTLKQTLTEAKLQDTEKIGDRDTYVVVGRRGDKTPVRLYFDQQSGLLLRLVRFGETPLGRLPTQIDYADYRDVNGVKTPFRFTQARPNGRFTIQMTDVKDNVPVDDAQFAKPAAKTGP